MITDMAHTFDNDSLTGDLDFTEAGLFATETSLKTAILHSIFSKARISEAERELYGVDELGGWLGSELTGVEGDNYGSKRWVLQRAKATEHTKRLFEQFTLECLNWLIEDGHAVSIEYESEWGESGQLKERVVIILTDGQREEFNFTSRSN